MFAGSVVPALITPLRTDGEVDREGCARLLDRVLARGADALLMLGSTGESATLGDRRRSVALQAFTSALENRAPFAVGITEPSLPATLRHVEEAVEAGADAVVVTPPYYAPVDQETVARHYAAVAEASPVPVLAYNIPSFTGTWVEAPTMRRLLEEDVVAGIKDSSANMEYLTQVLLAAHDCGRSEVLVYTGMDTLLLPSLTIGATGAIAASSNFVPDLSRDLVAAFRSNDLETARALQRRLVKLIGLLRLGPLPVGIKGVLRVAGVCGDTPAAPLVALDDDRRQRLGKDLAELGLLD